MYWAQRVVAAKDNADFASHLTLLCNAGDDARWGIARLLNHQDAALRQAGVVALQNSRGAWSRGQLVGLLRDADDETADLAAAGLAIRRREFSTAEIRRLFTSAPDAVGDRVLYALGRAALPGDDSLIAEYSAHARSAATAVEAIDALSNYRTQIAVAGLMKALHDQRVVSGTTVAERIAGRAWSGAGPATSFSVVAPSKTPAYRAAVALGRLTGMAASDPESPTSDECAAWAAWAPR
ncbi:MAG: hypothetical protein JNG88_15865 [Phycisphaerales bacterium]|nr:hypothetical protein [Phycisphaerales bacterium]